MEWNQPLFEAFMAAVVGSILYVQYQLHRIQKKLSPKERDRNASNHEPFDGLCDSAHRCGSKHRPCAERNALNPAEHPTESKAGSGCDETPPVS